MNRLSTLLLIVCPGLLFGQSVHIEGPDVTCPNEPLNYHIYAKNVFGVKVAGSISYSVYVDGVYHPEISHLSGGCNGDDKDFYIDITYVDSQGDTYDGWGSVGNIELRASFITGFCTTTTKSKYITSRAVQPGVLATSDGGLTFCGGGETRLVSLTPGFPYTPVFSGSVEYCYYHYQWKWSVPSGWGITLPSGGSYDSQTGTLSQSVLVTSPANLQPGAQNLFIKVEDTHFPSHWISDITREIHVGKPIVGGEMENGQLLGYGSTVNNVCNLVTQRTDMFLEGDATRTWQKITSNPSSISWSQTGDNISFYFYAVGQTATFRLTTSNACGSKVYDYKFKSVDCSGGGGCTTFALSPNPASQSVGIIVPNIPAPCGSASLASEDVVQSEESTSIQTIQILSFDGQSRMKREFSGKIKEAALDISGLDPGVYMVRIVAEDKHIEMHRLIVQ